MMDMVLIIATVSENCLVMALLVFDVLYHSGTSDLKSYCQTELPRQDGVVSVQPVVSPFSL